MSAAAPVSTGDPQPSTSPQTQPALNPAQRPDALKPPKKGPIAVIEKHVQRRIFKIIVIGDSNVGKTCLTYRFCAGRFPDRVEATIGVDFREKEVTVDNETIKLQLWDTAGQERFRKSMVQHYYRNVHAVVFVYDVTKRGSFDSLPQWIQECDSHHLSSAIPRIMVGNKCDMVADVQISTHEAQRFSDQHHMPLFETSAKDDSQTNHVEAIFMTLAHKLKTAKPLMTPTTPPNAGGSAISQEGVGLTRGARLGSASGAREPGICGC